MKSSIFAALVGLATAGGSLRAGEQSGSGYYSATTETTYTTSSSTTDGTGLQTFIPVVTVGGGNAQLTGVSDLAATNLNVANGVATGLGNGAASLSNIGTGAVLITSTTTGQSNLYTGQNIDGNYPKANINVVGGASSSASNNVVASGVISTAISNSNANANLNLNNLFGKLPSSADVDNLIIGSDTVALLKLVQSVGIDTTIPCDKRIAYLLELQGRIKAAIEKKNYAADQLKIVIDGANAEVIRLQGLINANNKDIDALGLADLNNKLNGLLTDLQTAYANYNKIDSQIPVLEAQVAGNTKEIDILTKSSETERNAVNNNRLKLSDIINQINTLQGQLKILQDKQAAVLASIDKATKSIANNDAAILALKTKIAGFQATLRDLQDKSDTFSSQTRDLEVKVNRLRTDISTADAKKTRYLNDIAGWNDRIDIERRKAGAADLTKLNGMVDGLKKLIPTVESEVDRHYYYCFGDGKVQVQTTGGVVVYVVRGDAFGNYLRNLYGRNVVMPAVNGDVLFNRVDIFGAPWVGAFGYPFGNASLGGADLAIGGSFGCNNPGSVSTGYGTISAIGSNYIEALGSNGAKTRLSLGACSRLESTKAIPAVGQKFYWSGAPGASGINLYSGSCF